MSDEQNQMIETMKKVASAKAKAKTSKDQVEVKDLQNHVKQIDLGIGNLRLPAKEDRIKTKRSLVGKLSYAQLLGDENNTNLSDRITEYGLIGILGAAREGKTALSTAISRLHDIPYYSILEPYEGQKSVNKPVMTLEDAVIAIEKAIADTTCDIVIIDSSRFVNSVRSYGLAPGGTPTAYNIILTMLHNAAFIYGKLIILVISTMTNEAEHLALMRNMVLGSSLGLIEPSLLKGGGSISVRGGDRDFIDFTTHDELFMKICNIDHQVKTRLTENANLSVLNNPKEILEMQDILDQDKLKDLNDFQKFLKANQNKM